MAEDPLLRALNGEGDPILDTLNNDAAYTGQRGNDGVFRETAVRQIASGFVDSTSPEALGKRAGEEYRRGREAAGEMGRSNVSRDLPLGPDASTLANAVTGFGYRVGEAVDESIVQPWGRASDEMAILREGGYERSDQAQALKALDSLGAAGLQTAFAPVSGPLGGLAKAFEDSKDEEGALATTARTIAAPARGANWAFGKFHEHVGEPIQRATGSETLGILSDVAVTGGVLRGAGAAGGALRGRGTTLKPGRSATRAALKTEAPVEAPALAEALSTAVEKGVTPKSTATQILSEKVARDANIAPVPEARPPGSRSRAPAPRESTPVVSLKPREKAHDYSSMSDAALADAASMGKPGAFREGALAEYKRRFPEQFKEAKPPSSPPVEEFTLEGKTARELREMASAEKARVEAIDAEILGPELAAEYSRQQRTANSMNDRRAAAASRRIAEIEGALTQAQRDRLHGIGEKGPNVEDLGHYAKEIASVESSGSVADLARSIRRDLSNTSEGAIGRDLSVAKIRRAMDVAKENGWDLTEVSDSALRAAFDRFGDPADAAFMLERFAKPKEAPKPPAPAKLKPAPAPKRLMPPMGRGLGRESGAVLQPFKGGKPKETLPNVPPADRAAIIEGRKRIQYKDDKPTLLERGKEIVRKVKLHARKETPIAEFERHMTGEISPTGPTEYAKYAQSAAAARTKAFMETGSFENVKSTPIEPALGAMKVDPKVLTDYVIHRRVATRFKNTESGFDPVMSESAYKEIAKSHPEVAEAGRAISEAFDVHLKEMRNAGVITPESYLRIKKANPNGYIPFERVLPKGKGGAASSTPANPQGAKKITGGTQPIKDPIPRIQDNLTKMRSAVEQARVMDKVLEMIDKDPARASSWVREVPPDKWGKGSLLTFDDFIKDFEAKNPGLFEKNSAASGLDAALSAYVDAFVKQESGTRQIVMHKGKPRMLEYVDKDLKAALHDMDPQGASMVMRVAQSMTGFQRSGITGLNPEFWATQLVKDPRAALVLTRQKGPGGIAKLAFSMVKEYAKAAEAPFRKIAGKPRRKSVQAFEELGAEGYFGVDRPKRMQRIERLQDKTPLGLKHYARNPKQIPRALLDAVREVSGNVESAPRRAEAALLLKEHLPGWKPGDPIPLDLRVQAANAASEVTVPFKLGGAGPAGSKSLNRAYPYYNPRAQGVSQMLTMMRNRPAAFALRVAATSVIPRLLLWNKNKDEDWYKRMPAWRRPFWNLSENVSVPFAHFIDVPGITLEFLLNKMYRDDPRGVEEVMKQVGDELSPIGDPTEPMNYLPTPIKGLVEVGTDRNAFSGRPINPTGSDHRKTVAPELAAHEYNSGLSRWAAKWMHDMLGTEATPAEIDHLFGYFGGTLARRTLRAEQPGEKEARDFPIVGRFVRRIKESRYVDDYYKKRSNLLGAQSGASVLKAQGKGGDAEIDKFLIPKAVRTKITRIDEALRALSDQYKAAPVSERRAIADEMDILAQQGLEIMGPALQPFD